MGCYHRKIPTKNEDFLFFVTNKVGHFWEIYVFYFFQISSDFLPWSLKEKVIFSIT